AIVVGAAAVVAVGWITRHRWLALWRPALPLVDIRPWQRLLEELEVRTFHEGAAPARSHRAPGGIQIACTRHALPDGSLWAYSLSSSNGALEARRAIAVAGLVAQRLPIHRIVRAGFGGSGVFHLWLQIERDAGPPGSTSSDRPELVRL